MKLSKKEIELIESLGFEVGENGLYEKEGDWQIYYLVIKNDKFFMEVQQTLIEEDGSFYNDYFKEYPNEDQSLSNFLIDFFN